MFAARRSVNQKNAQIQTSIVMTLLRLMNRVARIEPVYGDLIIRIGKTGACLAGHRCLARMAVGIPCRCNDRIKLAPSDENAGPESDRDNAVQIRHGPV